MAGRIRSIKPEILDDEEVSTLSDEAWRLWVSMWLLADDAGNCRAGDRYLASLVWQDSSRSPRVSAALRELQLLHRVEVYVNGGERYASIRNWAKHQRIDNAGKPRVVGPDHEESMPWDESRGDSPRLAKNSAVRRLTSDLRPPTPTNELPGFDFAAVYLAYPRKEGKKDGLRKCEQQITTAVKYEALVKSVQHYAAICEALGTEPKYVKHFDSFMSCWEDYADPACVAMAKLKQDRVSRPIPKVVTGPYKYADDGGVE